MPYCRIWVGRFAPNRRAYRWLARLAAGESDFLLKRFLGTGVKTLFTSLYDPDCLAKYGAEAIGRGKILGFVGEESGEGMIVRRDNVDVVYSTVRTSFTMKEHFVAMNIDVNDYDAVIVK